MRGLAPVEFLSLAKMLEMETQALTVSKTSLMAITDEQLKEAIQSGIIATEARITGLQQFITENNVVNSEQFQSTNQQQGVY